MLFKLANLIMGGLKFLGADGNTGSSSTSADYASGASSIATTIDSIVKTILGPILIVVGAAGIIWAIVLGINFARADSNDKREEAKKRLISLIVGVVIIVVLIVFFYVGFTPLINSFFPKDPIIK